MGEGHEAGGEDLHVAEDSVDYLELSICRTCDLGEKTDAFGLVLRCVLWFGFGEKVAELVPDDSVEDYGSCCSTG